MLLENTYAIIILFLLVFSLGFLGVIIDNSYSEK